MGARSAMSYEWADWSGSGSGSTGGIVKLRTADKKIVCKVRTGFECGRRSGVPARRLCTHARACSRARVRGRERASCDGRPPVHPRPKPDAAATLFVVRARPLASPPPPPRSMPNTQRAPSRSSRSAEARTRGRTRQVCGETAAGLSGAGVHGDAHPQLHGPSCSPHPAPLQVRKAPAGGCGCMRLRAAVCGWVYTAWHTTATATFLSPLPLPCPPPQCNLAAYQALPNFETAAYCMPVSGTNRACVSASWCFERPARTRVGAMGRPRLTRLPQHPNTTPLLQALKVHHPRGVQRKDGRQELGVGRVAGRRRGARRGRRRRGRRAGVMSGRFKGARAGRRAERRE
jgi:hypothetical protein